MFLAATPSLQVGGIVVTVVLALVFGKIAGIIVGLFGQKPVPYSDEQEFH